MATHWTDKRASVALVGQALAARGWKLYGWKEDRSDSMTDYYDPETWDGVAEHPSGAVACVDVSAYTVKNYSGGRARVTHEPAPDVVCPKCNGGRVEPGSMTYPEAVAGGGLVSPIGYFGHAWGVGTTEDEYPPELRERRRCSKCAGRGHLLKRVECFEVWPTFQANPARCSWHVERGGRIIARGTGVYSIREPNGHMEPGRTVQQRKLDTLVGRIEAAVGAREAADEASPGQVAGEGVTLRPGTRPGFVELHFAAKPPTEVRAELKAAGFRWSGRSRCWYGRESKLPIRWGGDEGHAPDIDVAAGY